MIGQTAHPPAAAARPTAQQAPAAVLRDVTVGYDAPPVLEKVNLTLDWGLIVGAIGPNGAGKSTLIKTILGILPARSGEVRVAGQPVASGAARRTMGYVPQREAVNWDFPVTVADVVLMGRTACLGWGRRPGPADERLAHEALVQVGMQDFAHRQISQLSGGQQQRVFLARALVQEGDLLLLDEPLNGVDASTQEVIGTLLRQQRAAGHTVVMATHDLELAAEWCDRIVLVNHGIVCYGPPAEVLTPDMLRQTYGGQTLLVPEEFAGHGATLLVPDEHGHGGGHSHPHTHSHDHHHHHLPANDPLCRDPEATQ
ncbi:MAG TPA: metal ABC transporter ATP-binding protein [Chloroflexia bacterium]